MLVPLGFDKLAEEILDAVLDGVLVNDEVRPRDLKRKHFLLKRSLKLYQNKPGNLLGIKEFDYNQPNNHTGDWPTVCFLVAWQ